MNALSLVHYGLLNKVMHLFNKVIPYRHKILFSSTFAALLLAIVAKTLELKENKRKLSKNQRKGLLQSKLFFRGVYQKIRIEITGHEGIKYSKMQAFLEQITHKKATRIPEPKAPKEDKVFYCILNNYLNRK